MKVNVNTVGITPLIAAFVRLSNDKDSSIKPYFSESDKETEYKVYVGSMPIVRVVSKAIDADAYRGLSNNGVPNRVVLDDLTAWRKAVDATTYEYDMYSAVADFFRELVGRRYQPIENYVDNNGKFAIHRFTMISSDYLITIETYRHLTPAPTVHLFEGDLKRIAEYEGATYQILSRTKATLTLKGCVFATLHLDRTNPLGDQYQSHGLDRPRVTELDDQPMNTADWQAKVLETCGNQTSRHLADSTMGGLQGTLKSNDMRAYYVRREYCMGPVIITHFRTDEGFTLDLAFHE